MDAGDGSVEDEYFEAGMADGELATENVEDHAIKDVMNLNNNTPFS